MTNCSGFLSLSPSARRDFCKSENLCFGCLRHGHSSKYCRRRLRCATCNRNHPTVLHDDSWQTRTRKILAQRTLIIDLQVLTTIIRNEIYPISHQRFNQQFHTLLLCLPVFEASQPIILVTWLMRFPKVT